jgi:transcriptional regulator with XRE-family HTH domain
MHKINIDTAPIDSLLKATGQRLDALRVKQGIKNEDLATKSGVNRNTLTRLWQGKPVNSENVFRVLRALGAMGLISEIILEPPPSPMDLIDTPTRKTLRKAKTKVYDSKQKEPPKVAETHVGNSAKDKKPGLIMANREEILSRYKTNNPPSNRNKEK